MAFWCLATHELVAFNDAFATLTDFPLGVLQISGFRWDDLWVDSRQAAGEDLRDSITRMRATMDSMKQGRCDYARLEFLFITGSGICKLASLAVVSLGAEVMWCARLIPEQRRYSAIEHPNTCSPCQCCLCAPQSSATSTPGDPVHHRNTRSQSFDATNSVGIQTKPVVDKKRVSDRVKKPWDMQLGKFAIEKRPPTSTSS
jgi:hypothetical protein